MDKVKEKHSQLLKALRSLEEVIICFESLQKEQSTYNNETYEQAFAIHRDSLIQRFEYCTDLFWKYIKKYLETFHTLPAISIPREVIGVSASLGLMNHDEAEQVLEMIKNRNKTSHIYVEEIADQLSKLIPNYYKLLFAISNRLAP